jgi:Glycosyl transferase family 2
MLRNEEKKKYEKNIVGKIINQYIAEDDWRLKNDFFGARGFPGGGSNIAIFIGARSGLEIIRLLEEIKSIKIIVVESNLALMTEIKNCLETYNSKKLTQTIEFYSKASELFESLNTSVIGIVRIDINSFHFQDVSYLIRNYQVDHIMGEFRLSDADPLEVFRLCKGNVGSFHWRIEGRSIPLCGSGKKSKVEVSVIVPCFKVLPWIDRCLETLANQTIKSFEIIAVNDGSPDDTGVRLDQWQQKFPDRIKVIHKKMEVALLLEMKA